jgi:pilus assembly protein Flp/PilA
MNAQIRKFFKEEDGVTALEYGLLAAVLAGIIIFFAQDGIKAVFDLVVTKLKAAVNGGTTSTPA